ncbi:MAG: aminotransferase class V-fold PLP-dependent enzyme [Thermocrispum sp.]
MDLATLRAGTAGCAHRVHLNNAGAALLSATTLTAMTDYLRLEAEIGGYEAVAASAAVVDGVYRSLARLVGGTPDGIALFDNSTHAWNAAFYSVPLGPGDRILTGRAEYGSSVLAYWQVARRTGADVVVVPDDEHGQIDVRALADLVDERTKLIGLTWVPTAGGLVNPAAAVGEVARAADVLYLLDATQVVGQLPIDIGELGCDLLTGTGRKFLRGPRGTGFLWAGPRALQRLEPFVAEIRSAAWDGRDGFTWAPGARRFETWENSYVNLVGLGTAVDQALGLGIDAIADRCRMLGGRLRDGLAAAPGVLQHDLGAERCAIVTASVDGRSADEVAGELARHGINVSTTVPTHNQLDPLGLHPLVRLSPHYYNTTDEVDRAVEVVAAFAG